MEECDERPDELELPDDIDGRKTGLTAGDRGGGERTVGPREDDARGGGENVALRGGLVSETNASRELA